MKRGPGTAVSLALPPPPETVHDQIAARHRRHRRHGALPRRRGRGTEEDSPPDIAATQRPLTIHTPRARPKGRRLLERVQERPIPQQPQRPRLTSRSRHISAARASALAFDFLSVGFLRTAVACVVAYGWRRRDGVSRRCVAAMALRGLGHGRAEAVGSAVIVRGPKPGVASSDKRGHRTPSTSRKKGRTPRWTTQLRPRRKGKGAVHHESTLQSRDEPARRRRPAPA